MKKNAARLAVAGSMLAALASPAQALTFTVTNGSFSSQAGASTVDFGVSTLNNSGPVAGSLPSGTLGGVTYSYSGGAMFNFDSSSSLPNGISARPVGSTGNYWSIGTSPVAQQGPGIIDLGAGVSYFGFLWGSPDASGWNSLSFFNGTTQLGATLDGSAILNPPDGNQSYARYFNVYADAGEVITSIRFSAST
ncbi:MAG: hypothetical protein ABUU24_08435, partial [Variovorax sp.]